MSNLCEKLINDCISVDCQNPIFSGVDSVGYIFNKSEITDYTTDATNGNIITAITMATSKTGFAVAQMGNQPFTGTQTEMATGTTGNKFNRTVNFIVYDNSPKASQVIDSLANGKFVFIMKNEYGGSDNKGAYEVFGLRKGLVATTITCEKYGDNEGAWVVTLVEENAPTSAMFLCHTGTGGTDDTATYLESLVDDCDE